MSIPTNRVKILGNVYSIKQSIAFVAVFSFLFSFPIMGTAFIHLFTTIFIALIALNLLALALTRLTNYFEFEDDKKLILKPFRVRIPYDKIQSISVNRVLRGFNVNVKTGKLQIYSLAMGLSAEQAALAENEFRTRFPFIGIHKESYQKRYAIVLVICLLAIVIVLGNFFYTIKRVSPYEPVAVERKDWLTGAKLIAGHHYQINGFDFSLPFSLLETKEEKLWHSFEDSGNKMKIKVGPGLLQHSDIKFRFFLTYVVGIRDDVDFISLGYNARFGLIPRLNNFSFFKDLLDLKIYEVHSGNLKGIVFQGLKGNKSIAEIIISAGNKSIQFLLSQPGELGKIKEELLQIIVSSIKPMQTAEY